MSKARSSRVSTKHIKQKADWNASPWLIDTCMWYNSVRSTIFQAFNVKHLLDSKTFQTGNIIGHISDKINPWNINIVKKFNVTAGNMSLWQYWPWGDGDWTQEEPIECWQESQDQLYLPLFLQQLLSTELDSLKFSARRHKSLLSASNCHCCDNFFKFRNLLSNLFQTILTAKIIGHI